MSTEFLFGITFYLAVPFWVLIIIAPQWTMTGRIMASPWPAALPLAAYFVLVLPHLGQLWATMSRPDLGTLREFAGSDWGAAALWAQLISFDLFIGRWMYFDSRRRGIHPLVMAPLLMLTILLSPFGTVLYLVIRRSPARDVMAGATRRPPADSMRT